MRRRGAIRRLANGRRRSSRHAGLAGLVVAIVLAGCGAKPPIIRTDFGVAEASFRHTMGNVFGRSFVDGNAIEALHNGDEIFPAMLEAIARAEHTITFETYIYWSGDIGARFTDALAERAEAGVDVNVILDALGSGKIDSAYLERMREAGVDVVMYRPLHWYDLTLLTADRLTNRTHRKIMVVDGRIGFTGGVGIADIWSGDAEDPDHWRDTHYRLEGPIVGLLQAAFADNWVETTGEVLSGDRYFPPPDADAGVSTAQIFMSSPEGGSDSVQLMYMLSIAAAREHIRIGTPYFVPDDVTTAHLLDARRRGVRVEIIVPGRHIDYPIVRHASRARWGPLLEAGVEIHEYVPTMYHCKLMIVDDRWTSIGSANFDSLSFKRNDEANVNVLDVDFAAREIATFEEDLQHCRPITHEAWRRRPLWERITDGLASLLGPWL